MPPQQIAAGSTLLFSERFSAYASSLYDLAFILNLNGAFVVNIAGTVSGDGFAITAVPTVTALWKPGRYNFVERLTKKSDAADVTDICSGRLQVTPNFAASATPTMLQNQLAALDEAILKLVSGKYSSITYGGQSRTQKDLRELFEIRNQLQAKVDAEQRELGYSDKGGQRRIVTRFTP